MGAICPSCKSAIPVEDINVATDLALCRACGKTFRFSEIVDGAAPPGPDLASPPRGAWYEKRPDGFTLGATTRSWIAVFLVPFTCVWSGISLTMLYGTQIVKGKFDLFSSLFGLPFLIGSCFLLVACALAVAGKTVVTRDGDRLRVFTGVGWLGRTRNYSWSDFRSAREDFAASSAGSNFNARGRAIALEGKRRITFGSGWTSDRRYFVLNALRSELAGGSLSQSASWASPLLR